MNVRELTDDEIEESTRIADELRRMCDELHDTCKYARHHIGAGEFDKAAACLEDAGHNLEIEAMMLRRRLPKT